LNTRKKKTSNLGFNIADVSSGAFSTTHPEKVKRNNDMTTKQILACFWKAMVNDGNSYWQSVQVQ